MPESTHTKLTGQVISIEKGNDYQGPYWVDIGLKLIEGHFVNVHYRFSRESIRDNIINSVQKGMTVTISAKGQADMMKQFDYSGTGSIQIQDLSNELDRYIRKQFTPSEDDYFSEREIAFIDGMLTSAKERIKETFNPSQEEMEDVEEHLDSLARKAQSVSKYDWRRLFVSCVVSVSIDLGFGATIPETLYNLFKKLVEEFVQHSLPSPER